METGNMQLIWEAFLPTFYILGIIILIALIYVLWNLGRNLGQSRLAMKEINKDLPTIMQNTNEMISNLNDASVSIKKEVKDLELVINQAGRLSHSVEAVNNLIEDDILPIVDKIKGFAEGVDATLDIAQEVKDVVSVIKKK